MHGGAGLRVRVLDIQDLVPEALSSASTETVCSISGVSSSAPLVQPFPAAATATVLCLQLPCSRAPPCVLQSSSRKECPVKHWLSSMYLYRALHHVSRIRTASPTHMGLLIISPRHKRSVPAAHVHACMAQVPARHMGSAKPGELPCLRVSGPLERLALRPATPWFLAPVRRCYREVLPGTWPAAPSQYPPYRYAVPPATKNLTATKLQHHSRPLCQTPCHLLQPRSAPVHHRRRWNRVPHVSGPLSGHLAAT